MANRVIPAEGMMLGQYAYALNGESYVGSFADRETALAAAIDAARRLDPPPTTLHVGRLIAADTKASGHARMVISNMAARAREEAGSPGAGYLQHLPKQIIEELDQRLETCVGDWLKRHNLLPTYMHVESISEHPLPAESRPIPKEVGDEVHDLGINDAAEV